MADKHTFRINQDKHRDVLIQKLYEQFGGGRSFVEFIKDVMYEVALSAIKNNKHDLLSLTTSNAPVQPRATGKSKKNKRPMAKEGESAGALVDGTVNSKLDIAQENQESDADIENKVPSLDHEEGSTESEDYEVKPEDILKTGQF